MIAPFYALSKGNPILPYLFLVITTILAIYILYLLGKKLGDVKAGLMAGVIASVSMYLIGASRWFSDPTPTLLISVLLVWSLFKFSEGKKLWLIMSGFLAGMALQFSAATEVFYVPAIAFIVFILRKVAKLNFKTILLSIFAFILPFAPQLVFELRHPGVQSSALINFIFHEKTFTIAFWEIVKTRIPFDYNMIASKFWLDGGVYFAPFFIIFVFLLILNWKKLWKSDKFKIVFTLGLTPLIGTLFFVSNLGGVYEYYFTGYYLIWILLFSHVYISSFKKLLVKLILISFLILLVFFNLKSYKENYFINVKDSKIATLSMELFAIDWVYNDANGADFNVDEYVPPVIPYTYQYLFQWYGKKTYKYLPNESNIPLLYTITEADPDHPERVNAWYARQNGLSVTQKSQNFGIINVERRLRINEK